MQPTKYKLILKKADYDLLVRYVLSRMHPHSGESKTAEQLYRELEDAEIHADPENIPPDTVRINSKVEVEELSTGRKLKFRLVLPEQANISKERLSVFAPLGIALIGYRKGHQVRWNMPSGQKTFLIRDVVNPAR